MDLNELKLTYGDGRYKIHISALITCEGISITITGGEKPHVGGTVLSVPRKSGAGEHMSCDTWICPVPGHKDTEIAVSVAETVCRGTGQTVGVIAGIHIHKAEQRELEILVENTVEATRQLVDQIMKILEKEDA